MQSTDWDQLFDVRFDREKAETLYQTYRETGRESDKEACFNAYVPLVGAVLKRKGIHRQDFDDALSVLSPGLWMRLDDDNVRYISAYVKTFVSRAALNFMRSHPLYSERLNPRPDGKPQPRRQLSLPDAVHLEDLARRVPELLRIEAFRRIRHGGVFRDLVKDAIECYVNGATPSTRKLAQKHGTTSFIAANLCQVAQVLVREAEIKLREEVRGLQYY